MLLGTKIMKKSIFGAPSNLPQKRDPTFWEKCEKHLQNGHPLWCLSRFDRAPFLTGGPNGLQGPPGTSRGWFWAPFGMVLGSFWDGFWCSSWEARCPSAPFQKKNHGSDAPHETCSDLSLQSLAEKNAPPPLHPPPEIWHGGGTARLRIGYIYPPAPACQRPPGCGGFELLC